MRSKIATALLLLVIGTIVVGVAGSAQAQIVYGQPAAGGFRLTYTNWTVDDTLVEASLSQFYLPVSGFIPVKDNLELTFFAANTGNTLEVGDVESKLNGMNDVRFQANQSFAQDHILVSVGVNLPTGKTELDIADEYDVLQALSNSYLDLPIRRLGEGFGVSLLFGGATVLGEGVRGGGSILYEYIGKYTPYADAGEYDPGDLISFNAGMDLERGPWLWSIEGIFSMYGDDKFDGEKTFKQSSQFDIRLRSHRGKEGTTFDAMLRYVARGDNTSYGADGDELDPFKLYGNEVHALGAVSFKLGSSMSLGPSLQWRSISENDVTDDRTLGSASVVGFGMNWAWSVSQSITLDLGGKYYTGSADGGDLDVTGYQVTYGFSATL